MYLLNPGRLARQKEKERNPQAEPFGGVDFQSKTVGG
jgi:hypothetical protein